MYPEFLGASGTGKVSFAISVVSYFTMVAALGIPTYGNSDNSESKRWPGKVE